MFTILKLKNMIAHQNHLKNKIKMKKYSKIFIKKKFRKDYMVIKILNKKSNHKIKMKLLEKIITNI